MSKICAALLLFIVFSSFAAGQDAQKAPELRLTDQHGRQLRLSALRGKVVLLNFWATWCPPCRAEAPELIRLQREYGARGLQVVGITYPPQTRREVRRFIRKFKINYPVALGTKTTKALFAHSETLPLTIVIDREGNIRDLIEGILLPEEFEQRIKFLISSSTRPPTAGRCDTVPL